MKTTAIAAALLMFAAISAAGQGCWPLSADKPNRKTHCPHYDAKNLVCWVGLEDKEYFTKGHPAIHLKADADKIAFCTNEPNRPFRILEFREMNPRNNCSQPKSMSRDPFQGEHYPKHEKGQSEDYATQKTTNKASQRAIGGCFKTTLEHPDRSVVDPHIIIDQ